jgi:hypothetical protein
MVPQATVAHRSAKRLRLRIASRRRDASFFDSLHEKMTPAFPSLSVQVNAVTASVLLVGDAVVFDEVAAFGRSKKLFEVAAVEKAERAMALSVTAPLHSANRQIRQVTGWICPGRCFWRCWCSARSSCFAATGARRRGIPRVDLPGAVFLALLVFGAVELLRGNWRTPPWYTAFWYAFGLYSKSLIDHAGGDQGGDVFGD